MSLQAAFGSQALSETPEAFVETADSQAPPIHPRPVVSKSRGWALEICIFHKPLNQLQSLL